MRNTATKLSFFTLFTALLWFTYNYFQPNFHTVINNEIFRSAQLDTETLTKKAAEHKVSTIVNLRGPSPYSDWYLDEKETAKELGLNHIDIKLSSTKLNRVNRIKELIDIYQNQPKPILFHCNGGADRAGLASAIVLLLEGKLSLEEVQKQTSWRYFAIKSDSTGKVFIERYQLWLTKQKIKHTPASLMNWVNNYYLDDHGKRFYRVMRVAGQKIPKEITKRKVVTVSRKTMPSIDITGSVMDYRGREILTGVEVLINEKPISNMLKSHIRPRSNKMEYDLVGYNQAKWSGTQDANLLKNGCYNVQLRLTQDDNYSWVSPPQAELCITP